MAESHSTTTDTAPIAYHQRVSVYHLVALHVAAINAMVAMVHWWWLHASPPRQSMPWATDRRDKLYAVPISMAESHSTTIATAPIAYHQRVSV